MIILIKTQNEKSVSIIHRIYDLKGIDTVNPLFGEYDMIAVFDADGDDIRSITEKISALDGVYGIKIFEAIPE
jgi:hypothetical protein